MPKKRSYTVRVFFAVFLFALLAFALSWISVPAADLLNRTVGYGVRRALAALTSWIPFSLIEILIYLIPLAIVLLVVWIVRSVRRPWRRQRWLGFLLCFFMTLSCLYIFTMGFAYHTETLDKKLGMTDEPVTAEELYKTAWICKKEAEALLSEIDFSDGESHYGGSLDELSDAILTAYDAFLADYPIFTSFSTRAKPVLASEGMSYAQILGVYSSFTGESNMNMCFPDYSLPFTVAHEFAHQRGIARENEANFIAFLVCIRSEDPYIRYSGYMNMYEYLLSPLRTADPTAYSYLAVTTDARMLADNAAYAATYKKYEGTVVGSVSSGLNDAYLQWNGTEGAKSYGLVVDLAVAYYREADK